MADVTYLHHTTDQPIPVARVLAGAMACTDLLVLGVTPTGEFYAAASVADAAQLV